MREALHVLDNEIVRLPFSGTIDEVNNLKKLAAKDLYQCPYCNAKLIVKSGEERGLYFSHQHSESCEISRKIDKAEKKYSKQVARETKKHKVIIDIIYDELVVQSKIKPNIEAEYGFKALPDLKQFPDIWVKIDNKEFAISIITGVNANEDRKLANQIINRHEYFVSNGLKPLWFIEKKEQSIEKEKSSIVLWDAELKISSKTNEDEIWDSHLGDIIQNREFFKYFNYPVSMDNLQIDVRSMYYIYSNDERIVVKVQRFLKDRAVKPYRAFMLNDGYEIPFADALIINTEFLLSKPELEEEKRREFPQKYLQLKQSYEEQLRIKEETARLEQERLKLEEARKLETLEKENYIRKIQRNRNMPLNAEHPTASKKENDNISYNSLKSLLKEKVNLTQKEQMELWNDYILRKKLRPNVILDLVINHECKSFDDLRLLIHEKIKGII